MDPEQTVRNVAAEFGIEPESSLVTFDATASPLLSWYAINNLTQHHLTRAGIQHVDEFPIHFEQSRVPLIAHIGAYHSDKQSSPENGAQTSADTLSLSPSTVWSYVRSFK